MKDNVVKVNFGGAPFPKLADVYDAIWEAIMKFEGEVPTLGVIGALRLAEHALLTEVHGDG
jgi:hypothetical protein